MAKKISISGYYGCNNFGDEEILSVLLQNLKSLDLNLDITVFSSNPKETSLKYSVKSIKKFNLLAVINNLRQTDILISGGGSLLQDVTSLKSLFYYLWVIFMALLFKKKVIIFAQGIGPINSPLGRFITKNMLKKVSYISVRDDKSLFLLRGWGMDANLMPDPMWNLNLPSREPKGNVGIQLRSWKSLSDKFINTLAREVAANFSDKYIYIYSFQDSQDLEVCKKFQNFLSLLNNNIKAFLINGLSNEAMVSSFRSLDYLIAMRYHACLLGIKYNIPTLPVSYDQKVTKLAEDTGLNYLTLADTNKIGLRVDSLRRMKEIPNYNEIKTWRFDFNPIFEIVKDST